MSTGWTGLEWAGDTVAVLASGTSLSAEQVEQVRIWRAARDGRRVIAINTTFRLAPWADVLYACDAPWWAEYIDAPRDKKPSVRQIFRGELWTQDGLARDRFGVKHIMSMPSPGLGRRPGVIHQGQNSGFQAVNLAWQAGAARILLLGFDMHGGHWHGEHPKPLTNTMPHLFSAYLRHFERMAIDLRALGCEVINCTPGSALTCFPTLSLDVAIAAEALSA